MDDTEEDFEVETEEIVINEVKEIIIDPKEKEKWDDFNSAWRNKLKEKNDKKNEPLS